MERPSDSNVVLRLDTSRDEPYPFQAGQWLYVRHDLGEPEPTRAAYSIASPPHESRFIELCVKKVRDGPTSSWLYDRSVGDELEISRPFGAFHFRSPAGRTAVFLATGTGIAPFRAMLLDQLRKGDGRPFWLFYGVGREVNLVYADEFQRLAQANANVRFAPVVSRAGPAWTGERGWVQEAFLHEFQGRRDFDAYVCGVKVMVDDVVRLLRTEGVPDPQIFFEKYV